MRRRLLKANCISLIARADLADFNPVLQFGNFGTGARVRMNIPSGSDARRAL